MCILQRRENLVPPLGSSEICSVYNSKFVLQGRRQNAAASCYQLSVMRQPLADMFQMSVLIMTNSNISMYCLDQYS